MINQKVEEWPSNVHEVRPGVCIFHPISFGGRNMVTLRKEEEGKLYYRKELMRINYLLKIGALQNWEKNDSVVLKSLGFTEGLLNSPHS